MNLDIDRVIEFIFPHKYELLFGLGLDGILVCFCCSSLNLFPSEPNDMNKTWLIQVSGGNSSVPQIRVHNRKLFSYFSAQKLVVCTQNNCLDNMVRMCTQNTCLN